MMKINELRIGLALLSNCIELWGGKSNAGDLKKLADALEKYDGLTLSEFINGIADKPIKEKPKTAKSNENIVDDVLKELEGKQSYEDFSNVIDVLMADKKRVTNSNLLEIARRYIGGNLKGKQTRDSIIKSMRDARLMSARASNKVPHISDIF